MVIFMGKKIHSIEEEKFIKAFGDKVRSLREKYNITQAELADRMRSEERRVGKEC